MNKKIIRILVILILLVAALPMNCDVYADDLEKSITLDNYKVLKGSLEEAKKRTSKLNNLTILEIKGEKAISKCGEEANGAFTEASFEYDKESKFSYGLQDMIARKGTKDNTERYEFVIYSNFSSPVEDVIKTLNDLSFRVNVQKRTFDSLTTTLSLNEITKLAKLKEIRKICLISETRGEVDVATLKNNDSGMKLNASTEMLGVEKARQDFNVSGNLDGDETSYSKNDVVICVIDTGIDGNHLDLDGGKIIGWYDAISGQTTPYDNHGHGSHVASIAAGTGEGDPGIQEGTAPGAALVGVKVLPAPNNSGAEYTLKGLEWIYANIDEYNIDVVNMSIGTQAPYDSRREVIDMINKIRNKGVPVFVSAGNEGNDAPYYNSLSTYAKYVSTSVGSVRDPYNGGWCLSDFSSRGTGTVNHPYILSCGEKIRAVDANTGDEYTIKSGTSMATPSITGIYALMYNAAYNNGGGTISFTAVDMGEDGVDKNYGGGRVAAYTSIKNAAGLGNNNNYTFNNYRNYIVDPSNNIEKNQARVYEIMSSSNDADLNISAIVLDESTNAPYNKVMIAVWEPGTNPYNGDASTYLKRDTNGIPQTHLTIPDNEKKQGKYYIAVIGQVGDDTNYTLEISGHEISPAR